MTFILSAVRQWTNSTFKKPQPLNPLLCDKCQCWNDVGLLCSALTDDEHESRWYDTFDISLHTRPNPKCLICDAVFAAANARLTWERDQGRDYSEPFAASHSGPVFVDDHYSCGYRVPNSRSNEFQLRLIIYVEIKHKGLGVSMLDVAPRFCLRFSKTMPTKLLSVDPWESPFFDIGLLKGWIHTCEGIHSDPPLITAHGDAGMSFNDRLRHRCHLEHHFA